MGKQWPYPALLHQLGATPRLGRAKLLRQLLHDHKVLYFELLKYYTIPELLSKPFPKPPEIIPLPDKSSFLVHGGKQSTLEHWLVPVRTHGSIGVHKP